MTAPRAGWQQQLLQFWFHKLDNKQRFARDEAVDRVIRRRFAPRLRWFGQQPSSTFLRDAQTARAAIILFDQVPRNSFRDDPRAFAFDRKARAITHGALSRGWLSALAREERQFLLMPLMHSEAIADQRESVRQFTRLGDASTRRFALAHWRMIARFGRFPHRNALLARASSPAETRAVAAGNHW